MRRCVRFFPIILAALALVASGSTTIFRRASAQQSGAQGGVQGGAQKGGPKDGAATLSLEAQRQISALLAEKQARTPAQRKIKPQLLYAMRAQRGQAMTLRGEVRTLRSAMSMTKVDREGLVDVIIKGRATKLLLMKIENLGGQIVNASETAGVVRARLPLTSMEELAGAEEVNQISPAASQATTNRQMTGANRTATPLGMSGVRPDFNQRAMNVRVQLAAALAKARARAKAHDPLSIVGLGQLNRLREQKAFANPQDATTNAGSVTSQGDVAHNAAAARNFFGVNGTGVKIGVLSDSVDFLAQSIASGNLPPDVTVLPGQSGVPSVGEGTAMLEIIHDVAPGAKLFFATAFISIGSFADNIRALRAAGCDIIVDDIIYFVESPFHDDVVSTTMHTCRIGILKVHPQGATRVFEEGPGKVSG